MNIGIRKHLDSLRSDKALSVKVKIEMVENWHTTWGNAMIGVVMDQDELRDKTETLTMLEDEVNRYKEQTNENS